MPDLDITFRSGRVDCTDSDAPDTADERIIPEPFLTRDGLLEYFADTDSSVGGGFGFTENEVVALMGAHTLGSAAAENSGWRGPWIDNEATWLNNRFYSLITDEDVIWTRRASLLESALVKNYILF